MELYTVIFTERKKLSATLVEIETFEAKEDALKYYQIKKELIDAECCEYMKYYLNLDVLPQLDELSLIWSEEDNKDDLPYYNLNYRANDCRLYIIKHNSMRME